MNSKNAVLLDDLVFFIWNKFKRFSYLFYEFICILYKDQFRSGLYTENIGEKQLGSRPDRRTWNFQCV